MKSNNKSVFYAVESFKLDKKAANPHLTVHTFTDESHRDAWVSRRAKPSTDTVTGGIKVRKPVSVEEGVRLVKAAEEKLRNRGAGVIHHTILDASRFAR